MASPAPPVARPPQTFLESLRARGGALATDDALACLLPLFRQVLDTHAAGRVAPLEGVEQLLVEESRVYFETAHAREPRLAQAEVDRLEAEAATAFDVVGQSLQTTDADAGDEEQRDLLLAAPDDRIAKPAYLAGYLSWEHQVGHHDALCDLYVLGLLLASVACGIDFTKREQAAAFARQRRNLFAIAKQLNPVLAKNILRLTELSRHRRAQDLASVIRSLERYRDQDVELDLDLSRIPGFHAADLRGRSRLVLGRLRERLFEISRRNRLLYFKPSLQTLNLTFASVPILLDVRSIKPEQIFSWHRDVERLLADGAPIPLARFLRFEDAPYLPSVLDKLISDARRDAAEYGFSQLRLVIAFLRWHNLKENAAERIDSPLLLVPVELSKKKGVRDSYVMRATSREAEVNPVLRHHLKQLFDIELPHSIDVAESTLLSFVETLQAQIQASEPGVVLTRIDRPQVELVYKRARRRLDQYRRRLRVGGAGLRSFREMDYSYSRDNYQPLGLRLFLSVVRPSPAPLHEIVSEQRPVHEARMAASVPPRDANEKERLFVTFQEGSEQANPYAWDFDLCSLTLGNFNYRKMSLVRDYNSLIESGQTSASFDGLFSLKPRPAPPEMPAPPLEPRFPVVACDPTQMRALALAASGGSYIIQGPPGTGKSQTITNLVADLVAQGKRILFVCEKRAAIDVVYHRLRQRGLHDLVCLIHDSQADKREFILDLKNTYEGLLKEGADGTAAARRARCLSAIERGLGPISDFDRCMREAPPAAGVPLRELLVRLVALSARVPELAPEEEDELPTYAEWARNADALERLGRALRSATRDGLYSNHPLAALSPAVAAVEKPRQAVEERLRAALLALDQIAVLCREHGLALGEGDSLQKLALWSRYAATVRPLADRGLLALLQPESAASGQLRDAVEDRLAKAEAADAARQATRAWRAKLLADDLAAALEQARALGSGLLRVLKGDFWRLRKVLNERYDFSKHAVRPSWVQILERLQAEYAADLALAQADGAAKREYGADQGLDAFAAQLDGVRAAVRDLLGSAATDRERVLGSDPARAVRGLVALQDALAELERSIGLALSEPQGLTLAELREQAQRILGSLTQLPDWLPCLAAAQGLPAALLRTIRDQPLDLQEVEAAIAARTLAEVWRSDREVARFGGAPLEIQAARLERDYRRWLEINAEVVLERTRQRFREHVALAALPSIRLGKQQDEFKRRYNAGRRELEHEFGKTMRYKSVRGLLAGPAGEVIFDLKPVWLMSPLSVSDTLPIDSGAFDAVVFDEASQIPLEEAVPPLFRAEQVIVSGDQMQLPPTNFFSATRTGEDQLLIEDEDESGPVEYELDANSFLSHAARNLPSTLLGWHYRSRSESLISFSNAAFYEGRLLTVPERALPAADLGEIAVGAPEEGEPNVARLLGRPVSFHFLEKGRYEARRNALEAAYIAHLVKALLLRPERPTIGIVAFSEAQQTQIETALERLAANDADFRGRLEQEYEREEDGQFAGLLVKNLENIQGDERDVILLSVCYGYAPDGRMLMNFGPINQGGGEKRLNVAFSRARQHMAVISSIRYADVKNVYNDGANALRSYLQYTAAMSSGDERGATAILRSMSPSAGARLEPEVDPVVRAIGTALEARGLETATSIGQSHFRCPLAVRRPGDSAYRVAVFVDTPSHGAESNVLEREVLKPGLLRSFGWTVVPVLTKDWQEDPEAVLARIERRLDGEIVDVPEAEPEEPQAPSLPGAPADEADGPLPPGAPVDTALPISALLPGQKRCFEFVGGTSRKFWHVSVDGSELVVVYGRIGSQGQVARKPFPTSDQARLEGERLIREKLGKGYQEV
jgi:predicted DNA-binding WGR domain protein